MVARMPATVVVVMIAVVLLPTAAMTIVVPLLPVRGVVRGGGVGPLIAPVAAAGGAVGTVSRHGIGGVGCGGAGGRYDLSVLSLGAPKQTQFNPIKRPGSSSSLPLYLEQESIHAMRRPHRQLLRAASAGVVGRGRCTYDECHGCLRSSPKSEE